MPDRGPMDFRDALSSYFNRVDRGGRREAARAVEVWPEAVGAEIAARTQATAVRGGELLVETDSPVWATELQAMAGQLVQAVNSAAGEELVRRVRIIVAGGARGRRARGATAAPGGPVAVPRVTVAPPSEEDRLAIERATASIEDDDLRAAAARAMAADIAWKRAVDGAGASPPEGRPKGAGEDGRTGR